MVYIPCLRRVLFESVRSESLVCAVSLGAHVAETVASQTYGAVNGAHVMAVSMVTTLIDIQLSEIILSGSVMSMGSDSLLATSAPPSTSEPLVCVASLGTHVAGTVASQTYGVAKGARVMSLPIQVPELLVNTMNIARAIVAVMEHCSQNPQRRCVIKCV